MPTASKLQLQGICMTTSILAAGTQLVTLYHITVQDTITYYIECICVSQMWLRCQLQLYILG